MSFEIQWDSVPAKRQKKVEKYSTPVLTLVAVDPEKKGAGRKMIFNKAAQEALGVVGEENVMFGFNNTSKEVFVKKSTAPQGFTLTKTCTLSDKKTFEFIISNFNLNDEVENEFDLVVSLMGNTILQLVPKVAEVTNVAPAIEFENRNLGEVSDEANTAGDLSGIPATPVGGAVYSEAEIVEDAVVNEPEVELANGNSSDMVAEGATVATEEEEEESEW